MKAKYEFNTADISKLELTISLTMTVEEWRNIMRVRQENYHYAQDHLQRMIGIALGDLTKAIEKSYSVDPYGERNNGNSSKNEN